MSREAEAARRRLAAQLAERSDLMPTIDRLADPDPTARRVAAELLVEGLARRQGPRRST